MLDHDLHIPLAHETWEFLTPLDQQNAVLRTKIIEGQRVELARSVDSIQIDVVKIRLRPAIFVHQRERRAGNVFLRRRLKCRCDPFDQSGLSRPEIAPEQHQFRRAEQLRQAPPKSNCVFRRVCCDFAQYLIRFGPLHKTSISSGIMAGDSAGANPDSHR